MSDLESSSDIEKFEDSIFEDEETSSPAPSTPQPAGEDEGAWSITDRDPNQIPFSGSSGIQVDLTCQQ